MRPGAHVEQIFLYCLGASLMRYDVTLHGYMAMSNHQHLIVRDNGGEVPGFYAHFNNLVARALNRHWGRWENLWAPGKPSVVHLVDAQDRFDKLVYLLANPVAAHLVDQAMEWPGASSLSQHFSGEPRRILRPAGFFRDNGTMPADVEVAVAEIDGFEHLERSEWSALLRGALRVEERRARDERTARKLGVLGRAAVLSVEPTHRPDTIEPRRKLSPDVACRNPERRKGELLALSGFRAAYRGALRRLRAGERDAVFPLGAYRIRRLGIGSSKTTGSKMTPQSDE
ncbi:MAG: hypothetical protein JWO86_6300 [Myxococcaceae bacterium]|nr:hypothetical protein [Myxococcaceae bacterium]